MVQDLVSMLMRKYHAEMKFYKEIVMPRCHFSFFFFFVVYCIPKQERP